MQKHPVIRHRLMFISFTLGIPLGLFLMFTLADTGSEKYLAYGLCVIWLMIMYFALRKVILLSFARTVLDENGITAKVPFRKTVTMKWEDVTRIGFRFFDGGRVYDQHWLCFINKTDGFPIKFKQLTAIPYPSENCIYMVYSEFVWEIIPKYVKSKIYSDAKTKSRGIP